MAVKRVSYVEVISVVVKELGLSDQTLRNWIKAASAMKVVYLAIQQAAKKWSMPIQHWRQALNRFDIEYGERINAHQ